MRRAATSADPARDVRTYLLLISIQQGDDNEQDEDYLATDNLDCLDCPRHGVLRAPKRKSRSASLECKSARVDGDGYRHTHSSRASAAGQACDIFHLSRALEVVHVVVHALRGPVE